MVLHQPGARLVAEGIFRVLIRPVPAATGQRVAVVARGVDKNASVEDRSPENDQFPQPVILGSIEIPNSQS
jgi:hypothetical protein